jgi:phage terminase large subunit-like protein
VVEDLSGRYPPETWGALACEAASRWGAEVVVETNCGGDMARNTISAAARMMGTNPVIHKVRAKENKRVRAEPCATLYATRRVKHVGAHPRLEQQLITYVPATAKRSPDRLDALCYALTHLFFTELVTIQNKKGR